MTGDNKREIELTVELTAAKMDLKFMQAIVDLEKRIIGRLDGCQLQHEQRRRWGTRTWIQSIGTLIALGAAMTALWKG